MDCMQLVGVQLRLLPEACFNTASGMDCMQLTILVIIGTPFWVSIPQAVWIACNEADGRVCFGAAEFQYRKRYGLHAILSPGSLGNSEPKNRVSNDDPLFAFFPKVSGTFLSRKVLRKGLEASHSKGTFVHERNLILMAFSLDFRASLEQSIS